LPGEQARSYLALAVTILLDAAAERDLARHDASIAGKTERQSDLIAHVRAHHPTLTEEEAGRHLELF
jgi:hypothetical protein